MTGQEMITCWVLVQLLTQDEANTVTILSPNADFNGQPDYAIIVPDLPTVSLQWGEYGEEVPNCNSLTDGLANTQAMLAAKCRPALHIADLSEKREHKDLYLPARGELWALRANVPELFEKGWHWSSTQYSSYYAFIQDFEDGDSLSFWLLKDNTCRVRPVRRIQLQHFTD